jgi:hypothetical protein
MSDRDLKNLFRQFTGQRRPPVPDVDDVIALSRLPHADEAAAPLRADLLRFSRELEPMSAALGADLAAAFGETGEAAAHRRMPPRRSASVPRRWHVAAAAMAAIMVAVVVVFATHGSHVAQAPDSASTATVPDRIFSGFDERKVAAGKPARGDVIFRGNFLPDEIFNSSRHHEG